MNDIVTSHDPEEVLVVVLEKCFPFKSHDMQGLLLLMGSVCVCYILNPRF